MSPRNEVSWMPGTSCFRTPFKSQRVHVSQTLLKSARQHSYPNFLLTIGKLIQKIFLSVRSEIWGLFCNTLTPDHMYSRQNWENFPQNVQRPLSQKPQPFPEIFTGFFQSTQNFAHSQKKRSASRLKYLGGYWVQQGWLPEFPKPPLLEHPSRVNVFTSPKHSWNLHGSTSILLSH